MEKLTKAQATLIDCLKALGVKKEEIIGVMLLIPEDDQIADMAEFLLENKKATVSEILEMAIQINQQAN